MTPSVRRTIREKSCFCYSMSGDIWLAEKLLSKSINAELGYWWVLNIYFLHNAGCTSLSSIPGKELYTNWFIIGLKWILLWCIWTQIHLGLFTLLSFFFISTIYCYRKISLNRPFCKRIWTELTVVRLGVLTGGPSSGSYKQLSRQAGPAPTGAPCLVVTVMSSTSKRWAHPYPRNTSKIVYLLHPERNHLCTVISYSGSSGKSDWRTDHRLGFDIL